MHARCLLAGFPLLLAMAACGPSFEPKPIRNVLLVSIDTLRADYLSSYGMQWLTTPNIDALAEEGARFELAIATNPITLPSHATMLTGTLPPRHGVRDNEGYRLAEDRITLAEVLQAHGFETGAVVGAVILDRRFRLDQGFDSYDDDVGGLSGGSFPSRVAGEVSALGVRFIEEHGSEPFLLFLHYYDPHRDYNPPEPYATRFAKDLYAGEVAYTDAQIGQVIAALHRANVFDSTLIVVTSDHGEAFGEHGEDSHAYFIYQNTQHVPLVIRAPGMRGSRVVPGAVGIVDVAPTVLGFLGIPRPGEMQGHDLSKVLRGESEPARDRSVYCESYTPTKIGCSPLLALVSGRWKYIHTSKPELYDLSRDPREKHNRIADEAEVAATLAEEVERVTATSRPGARLVDPELAKNLLALGYLKGEVDETSAVDPTLPDPKDSLEVFNKLKEVAWMLEEGDLDRVKRAGRELLRLRPDLIDVHRTLGDVAYKERDWQTAIVKYQLYLSLEAAGAGLGLRGQEMARQRAELHQRLGVSRVALNQRERAEQDFRRSIELQPELPRAHFNLGRVLIELGREAEAEAPLREALRLDPGYERARIDLESIGAPL